MKAQDSFMLHIPPKINELTKISKQKYVKKINYIGSS